MGLGIDYEHLDATSTLDFAIGLEEDEHLRYREFALCVRHEATARFFRELGEREAQHLRRLESRRDLLVRHAPARFDTSASDEDVDAECRSRRISARRALVISERAERKAVGFYSTVLRHVRDAELRDCLAEVCVEAEAHRRAIEERLHLLGAE